MNYTLFAIACYIILRGLQVLLENHAGKRWYRILINGVTLVMLYAALSSLVVWYHRIYLLGFDPSK